MMDQSARCCKTQAEFAAQVLLRKVLMEWTPPTASMCQNGDVDHHLKEASMKEISIIGLDLAKSFNGGITA
jgi:hypothetical protein